MIQKLKKSAGLMEQLANKNVFGYVLVFEHHTHQEQSHPKSNSCSSCSQSL